MCAFRPGARIGRLSTMCSIKYSINSVIFICLCIGIASNCSAASFDCTKASSISENIICMDPELSQKDDELGYLFTRAKSLVGNDSEFRKNNVDAWRWREANCFDRSCLINWYATRKVYFQSILTQADSRQSSHEIKITKCTKLGLVPGSRDFNECIK
jgi:uncharacterized protein